MATETETLRAAYNRARQNSGGRLKTWWDNYLKVRDYYEEHEGYEGVTIGVKNWPSWSTSVRKAWKQGNLSKEQIMALNDINFPKKGLKTGYKNNGRGSKITWTLTFKEISKTIIPLTDEEQANLDANISHYQESYNNGRCSEKTAKRLGLKMYI